MKLPGIIVIAVVVLVGLFGSVYQVREDQTALVLNLGKVVRYDVPPGLHFKIPLLETARVFDRRFKVLETQPERYLTSERKDVSIDFFAIGYISDVRAFYRATGGEERVAESRLEPIIANALRNQINARTLQQLVSGDRDEIVASQLKNINDGAKTLGVNIVDLRLKQIDLPTDSQVITDVYARMSAQRKQVASKLRAEGEEQARTIRAGADRDAQVIVADAERDAQRARGEGDAQATKIYADASKADPGFYAFYRSLEAYRGAFGDGGSVIVLDKSDPFLQYLKSDR